MSKEPTVLIPRAEPLLGTPTRRRWVRQLSGPLAALLVALALVVAERLGYRLPAPGQPLTILIAYAGFVGGLGSALATAALSLLACSLFFADGHHLLPANPHDLGRLAVFLITFPLIAVMVGLLRRRLDYAAAQPLREREELFAAVMAAMHDAILETDWRGIREVNDSFCRMTGFSRAELLGARPPYPFWPTEQYAAIATTLERSMRGQTSDLEMVLARKNGERFPVLLSLSRIPTTADDPRPRTIFSFKDITDLKRAEEALGTSQSRLDLALAAANMGIWEWDVARDQTTMTSGFAALWGVSSVGQLTRQEFLARIHPEDLPEVHRCVAAALAARGDFQVQHRVVLPDGSFRWIVAQGRIIPNDHGELHLIGVARDITAQKAADVVPHPNLPI